MPTWLPPLQRHDERVLRLLVLRRRRMVDAAMRTVTQLGDARVAIPLVLALMLGLAPGLEGAGVRAAFALSLSHLWVQLLKRSIARPRPRLPDGACSLIRAPDRFSFPSGHAAAALSIALPVAAALPHAAAVPAVLLAVVVGCSRCYLGVHYPSDVVAGWLLAAAAALLAGPALGMFGGLPSTP